MNRRTAVKNFLMITAGVVFIPSCYQQKGKPTIVLKNLDISRADEDLLAEVCGTMIPTTSTPGAKDLGAHLFVLKMLDDCNSNKTQELFIKGIAAFDKMAHRNFGESFADCSIAQRLELFKTIESKNNISAEISAFYENVKKYTIEAYTTSKYYLTKVRVYELIPGRFNGCVPIEKKSV